MSCLRKEAEDKWNLGRERERCATFGKAAQVTTSCCDAALMLFLTMFFLLGLSHPITGEELECEAISMSDGRALTIL